MGLFGGFRAKFTKDSTAKAAKKGSKKNDVVCVGFKIISSEFQDPPEYLPHTSQAKRGPTTIKTVLPPRAPLRTVTDHAPNEIKIITNPKAKKTAKEISLDLTVEAKLKGIENERNELNSTTNSNHGLENVSGYNTDVVPSRTEDTENDLFDTISETQPKSILKSKSMYTLSKSESESDIYFASGNKAHVQGHQSYLTILSENVDGTTATAVSKQHYITNVEISNNDNNKSHGVYNGYSSRQNTCALGKTSSFAANIFFEGYEEPEIQRPRTVNVSNVQDDERRKSVEC